MFVKGDKVNLVSREPPYDRDVILGVGTVMNVHRSAGYPITVKWENGRMYGYEKEALALDILEANE